MPKFIAITSSSTGVIWFEQIEAETEERVRNVLENPFSVVLLLTPAETFETKLLTVETLISAQAEAVRKEAALKAR